MGQERGERTGHDGKNKVLFLLPTAIFRVPAQSRSTEDGSNGRHSPRESL